MNTLSEIRDKIRKIATASPVGVCYTAKVVSVDGECCTVELEGMRLTDVRLRAVVNGEESRLLITPKVDSYVQLLDLNGDFAQMMVIAYSEVDKVELTVNDTIAINADDTIVMNGGNNDGLVKINELTRKLNELVDTFNGHTHTVATTGSATAQEGTAAATTSPASTFNKRDYENDKILH